MHPVITESRLDCEAGHQEQQLHLAGVIHVTVEIAHVAIDGLARRKLIVQKSDFGALLVRQVSRGFVAKQPCAGCRVACVHVDLEECARRRLHRFGVSAQIRHGQVHDETAARNQVRTGARPRRHLIFEGQQM